MLILKVGILADDLTSAMDGAAPFVSMGHRCVVRTDHGQSARPDATIVSVNKASRTASGADAAERAANAAESLAQASILYNTVDSTLRGHLAVEILSALAASDRSLAVLAPAFPAGGRTTEGGRQLLRGVPLEKTEFANDPLHPVGESLIRAHFPTLADSDVRLISLSELRSLKPGDLTATDVTLLIADAVEQDDLTLLVRSAADPKSILWCGSPGLAHALASYVGRAQENAIADKPSLNLFVIGSLNPLSREQYSAFATGADIRPIVIDAGMASTSAVLAAEDAIARFGDGSRAGGDIVLMTSSNGTKAAPRAIATALGLVVREIVKRHPVTGLFLTGGDTAEAVMDALDIGLLELLGEIEPGIPIGQTTGPESIHVVTKAGGFGSLHVLQKSAATLRGLRLGAKK